MERLYRVLFLALFILGFIGAVASADRDGIAESESSLLHDIRLAEEVNALNEDRWNQDVSEINQDGLARVEALLNQEPEQRTVQK